MGDEHRRSTITRGSSQFDLGGTPAGKTTSNAAQAEKVDRLFGEFKGLRAQFTEMRKQIVGAAEMKAMKDDMKAFRQEIAGARQANAGVQQIAQTVEQHRQQIDASAQATAGLQREMLQIERQVEPLMQQVRHMQQEQARLSNLAQDQNNLRRRSEEATQQLRELSHRLQNLDGAAGHATEAKREVERMRQDHTAMVRRNDEAMRSVQESVRTVDQIKSESKRSIEQLKQEVNSVKNEYNGAKGAQKEQMAHMKRLEERTRGMDDLNRLKTTVDSTGFEFWTLKKQLYDAGVLAPPKIPEPEKLPVGTLELGEDCFTARLLIRLGLMKATQDSLKELEAEREENGQVRELRAMDAEFLEVASDASSDAGLQIAQVSGLIENLEEDVTGLQVPEIEPGGRSQLIVTVGWVGVCIGTLAVQALIVFIMVAYGIEAGDDCMKEPLSPAKWYMLHVSKAAATLAAGMLMGKELMDIVNYWMVSELLETKTSIEVVVSSVLRILLILFIAMANVIIFMTMTSPADVWINMTALGFIGELSSAVLDIAKRGVFGHDIGKAVTSVNYSLNFMTDYPWWFIWARSITLLVAFTFISFFAFVLYIMPDNVCLADGTSEAGSLLQRIFDLF